MLACRNDRLALQVACHYLNIHLAELSVYQMNWYVLGCSKLSIADVFVKLFVSVLWLSKRTACRIAIFI